MLFGIHGPTKWKNMEMAEKKGGSLMEGEGGPMKSKLICNVAQTKYQNLSSSLATEYQTIE